MPAADVSLSPRSVTFTVTRRTAAATFPVRRVTDIAPDGEAAPALNQLRLFDGSALTFFDGSPLLLFP